MTDFQIAYVDLSALTKALPDLFAGAANTDAKTLARIREITQSPDFQTAIRQRIVRDFRLAANPHAAVQYEGPKEDGNPFAFFIKYFRLHVETGNYSQSNLNRDCARLFNAMRNALRDKKWQKTLGEAEEQLVAEGLSPIINGRHVRDILSLDELWPSRKRLEPSTPAKAEKLERQERVI